MTIIESSMSFGNTTEMNRVSAIHMYTKSALDQRLKRGLKNETTISELKL